jgi:DNA-binding XRE family transcriptional regulator
MKPREAYEDLVDARDAAIAMRNIAAGAPTFSETELNEFLAAPTPLAYFRKRAGLTQVELARRVDVTQPYLAQLESGVRTGPAAVVQKLARVLEVRMEDQMED